MDKEKEQQRFRELHASLNKNCAIKQIMYLENKLAIGQGLVDAEVKQAACGKWQREKPTKPCYFIHRYNKQDDKPDLFDAILDNGILCVANIQDDAFVEAMENFADGEFYIVEYH
jgi:hypothetical protein